MNVAPPAFIHKEVDIKVKVTASAIRAVAKTFPFDTSCIDGMTIKLIGHMSETMLCSLAGLFMIATTAGDLPAFLQNLTVLRVDKKKTAG